MNSINSKKQADTMPWQNTTKRQTTVHEPNPKTRSDLMISGRIRRYVLESELCMKVLPEVLLFKYLPNICANRSGIFLTMV